MIITRSAPVWVVVFTLIAMSGGPVLGQEKDPASSEEELNRLEAAWTMHRNRASLQANQIRKLLKQHDLDPETFDLVFEAEREWWLALHRRFKEADLEWKIAKARMEHAAKDGGADDEEVIEIRRELQAVRSGIQRAQMAGMGQGQLRMKELEAQAKSLVDHLAVASRRRVDRLRDEVGELDAVRQVLQAEFKASSDKLRLLGRMKSQLDALRAQAKRYTAEADRLYQLWERLQSK